MKKYLFFIIPSLMFLSACNQSQMGLGAEQSAILEGSLLGGQDDSRNSNSTKAKSPEVDGSDLTDVPPSSADDGSHSLNPDAAPGHGPVTLTPAFPSSGDNDYQASDGSGPQVQRPWQFQEATPVRVFDDHTNLSANAEDQGVQETDLQAMGDRPEVSVSDTPIQVYDPFCNCYKTGPYQGPTSVQDANIPSLGVRDPALGAQSNANEDEDSDD